MIICLIAGQIEMRSLHKMSYYLEPNSYGRNKIKVELHFSDYAEKSKVKQSTGFNTSNFVKNADLVSLKFNVVELDVDEFKTIPFDLSKLSNVEDKDVVEKTVHDELVQIFNAIDSHEPNLGRKIEDVDKKIPDTINFVEAHQFKRFTKINFNAKIAKALKHFATKNKVETALYIGDEKQRNKTLII